MFRRALLLTACLAIGLASPALAAPCVEGAAEANTLDMRDMEKGAPILVALSLWTGVLVKQDLGSQLKRAAKGCERGAFEVEGKAYALRGDSNEATLARVAMPASKKDPMGYLTPAPDLVAALTPGHKGPAPILGYALVTVAGDVHTTWRIYDKIPIDAVLQADFAEALSGKAKPLMRWRGGKIEIIV